MTTFTLTIDEKNKYIADYLTANNIDDSQLTFEQLLAVLEDAEDYASGMEVLSQRKDTSGYRTHSLKQVADELGIVL